MLFAALPTIFIVAVFGFWMVVSGLARGNVSQSLIGAAAALFLLPAAPIIIRIYRTRRSAPPVLHAGQTNRGERTLPIPRWRWFSVVTGVFSLTAVVVSVIMLFALAFPDATLNYRLCSPIVVPLLIVVMAIGLWILVREIYAEKGIRGLWLTSTGLHLGNGMMYQVADWDDILEIQAAAQPRFATIKIAARPGAVDLVWASRWARKKKTRTWLVEIYTLEFDVDSALLYHLLNFYWKHPALRVELASDAAVARVRRGEVLDHYA